MKNRTLLFSLFLFFLSSEVSAQPEFIDNSFGTGGKIVGEAGTLNALSLNQDRKIIAVGFVDSTFWGYLAIARYDTTGVLDSGFSTTGLFVLENSNFFVEIAEGVIIQPDNKIIVGGGRYYDFGTYGGVLFRLNQDGSVDSSFLVNSFIPVVNSIALQPDGKILTLGINYNDTGGSSSSLVRYNPEDGSLDLDFGNNGSIQTDNSGHNLLAIQSDGKILTTGRDHYFGGGDYQIIRYSINGMMDESFSNQGIQTIDFPIASIAVQSNDKIIVGGNTALARFDKDGNPDDSFGMDGKVLLNLGSVVTSLSLDVNGNILVAGEKDDDFFLARFLPDGTLDETAGVGGIVTTDFDNGNDYAKDITVQPNGKIILAGESDGKFAVARYLSGLETGVLEKPESKPAILDLSPNPATNFLNIHLSKATAAPLDVQVFDAQGKLLRYQPLAAGQQLDVQELAPGMYSLRVVVGERVFAGRFVKQ